MAAADPTVARPPPTREERDAPRPGSEAALAAGCRCPVLDNGHGRGWLGDGERYGWCVNGDCPLHGAADALPAGDGRDGG